MSSFVILLSILTALLLGAMSPGPSFVLVSRIAVVSSRRAALAAALGMGIGGAVFAGLALFGLTALLLRVEWLYLLLKLSGGLYLLYLGIRIWRGARQPLAAQPEPLQQEPAAVLRPELRQIKKLEQFDGSNKRGAAPDGPTAASPLRAGLLGLATQLSNPKTAVVYASIFAALLPARPETWMMVALPISTLAVEAGWYAVVALVFSASRPRAVYIGWKSLIDRAAGGVMGLLGLRLLVEALPGRTP
jgi:threonine/homoserine/homoserine lactone efflux protein